MVRQADDPFVYFDAKLDKGFGLGISNKNGSGRGKAGPREDRASVGKETQRGVGEERPGGTVDNG